MSGHRYDWALLAFFALVLFGALSSTPAFAQAPPDYYLSLEQLRDRYVGSRGRFANIGGVDVHYRDEGSGPVILMVHGSQSTLRTWDGITARLRHRYRIIRYDVPPHGLSGPVSDEAAARLAPVDIATGLLERLGVSEVTFVGVSSGGTLGIQLAAARPDLVNRLIVSNAPSDPVDTSGQVMTPVFQAAMDEARTLGYRPQRFWDAFLDFYTGDPSRLSRSQRAEFFDFNRRAPEPNLIDLVAQVRDHERARAAMAAVTAPTLLIWGGSDALLPIHSARVLEGYLTSTAVSTVIMPDVGHYPPMEAPDRFAQIVVAFIEAATPRLGAPE